MPVSTAQCHGSGVQLDRTRIPRWVWTGSTILPALGQPGREAELLTLLTFPYLPSSRQIGLVPLSPLRLPSSLNPHHRYMRLYPSLVAAKVNSNIAASPSPFSANSDGAHLRSPPPSTVSVVHSSNELISSCGVACIVCSAWDRPGSPGTLPNDSFVQSRGAPRVLFSPSTGLRLRRRMVDTSLCKRKRQRMGGRIRREHDAVSAGLICFETNIVCSTGGLLFCLARD
ncbi:uncharacterized protein SCHCODRAFT_01171203 [Schizophyllum commune H4-8]|nr:uncharacterized protein SCHCODRAFT_01171203 [Schizophyllum commune H4-8]KAI5891911.1 hypothetical protein SCHCODRAFT_01171203 [Schizophyllum commune H4-8]